MTKNPWLNALGAALYIVVLASLMFYGTQGTPSEDSVWMPMIMMSLLTLSAAVMAWIFFFQPVQLYLDGEKQAAVRLFRQTLAIFAGLVIVALAGIFIFNFLK
jgi:hypothetical protein